MRTRLKDWVLLGLSAVFYAWAVFSDLARFALYILFVYAAGLIIEKLRRRQTGLQISSMQPDLVANADNMHIDGTKMTPPSPSGLKSPTAIWPNRLLPFSAIACAISIVLLVGVLYHFKYVPLMTGIWNQLFKDTLGSNPVVAPLGLSFITFSAISYLVDIAKLRADAGSFLDCALYLSFFPKVVSGPIVLWRDFAPFLNQRSASLQSFCRGIDRVCIGFAKKLILADSFGACIAGASPQITAGTAWGLSLLYMLQIYYDFAGYSDIAIGLAAMFGFDFQENFNFPYVSTSISEFWRRWHISLGRWFREYVYIPLGGNRHGKTRTLVNIAIVFLLTGFWHGAGFSYIVWGGINAACMIFEKCVADRRFYRKTPAFIKWFLTMSVTFFAWQIFRLPGREKITAWFAKMFGQADISFLPYTFWHYFDNRMIVFVLIACIGATLLGLKRVQALYARIYAHPAGEIVLRLLFLGLFVISIFYMVNSQYSPFLYFQY